MADIPVHVTHSGDDRRRSIVFENGDSESLLVTPMGPDLFLLEESFVFGEGRFHDVIRASANEDGSLLFHEVVSTSGLHTEERTLSKSLIESAEVQDLLAWVMNVGGMWEQIFGGVLFLHVPPNLADTLRDRIDSLRRTALGNLQTP
jgi:hypothetical protein